MEKGWLFLIVLVLAGVLGVMLRNRYLAPGTPFRRWFDARLSGTVAKAVKIFCFVTVGVWLLIWATADPEDRTRLGREFQAFIKSVEWGRDETDTDADTEAEPDAVEKMP